MSIEFRCPRCQKLLRVGDDAAGREATCPACGAAVTVPTAPPPVMAPPTAPPRLSEAGGHFAAAPPLPSSANPYAAPQSAGGPTTYAPGDVLPRNGPPWERDGASFASLFATIKEVSANPIYFFSTLRRDGGIGKPLLFYWIVNAGSLAVFMFLQFAMQGAFLAAMQPRGAGGALAGAGLILLFWTACGIVLIPFSLFIVAAIHHVILAIFRGANFPFEATLRAAAYAGAGNVIVMIPFCGPYIASVVVLVFFGIGLCCVHWIPGWKAALTVIMPSVICTATCTVLFLGAFVSAIQQQQRRQRGFQPNLIVPSAARFEEQLPLNLQVFGCDCWAQPQPRGIADFVEYRQRAGATALKSAPIKCRRPPGGGPGGVVNYNGD